MNNMKNYLIFYINFEFYKNFHKNYKTKFIINK